MRLSGCSPPWPLPIARRTLQDYSPHKPDPCIPAPQATDCSQPDGHKQNIRTTSMDLLPASEGRFEKGSYKRPRSPGGIAKSNTVLLPSNECWTAFSTH